MKNTHSNRQLEDEAIHWLARLNASDFSSQEEKEFFSWLELSSRHQAAYIKAEQLWSRGEVLAMVTTEVKITEASKPNIFFGWGGFGTNGFRGAALACSVLFVIGLAFFLFLSNSQSQQMYETLIGEIKQVRLDDGSQLTLNTDSRLKVVLTEKLRIVNLEKGEAAFNVAKDPSRPFEVVTEMGVVRVTGTYFAVRQSAGDVRVTVIEGGVLLLESKPTDTEQAGIVVLKANESISFTEVRNGNAPRSVDAGKELAWRNKQLIFRGESLGEVVEELDKYFPGTLSLANEALGKREVTAVLKLGNIRSTLDSIEYSLGLQARIDEANNIVLEEK